MVFGIERRGGAVRRDVARSAADRSARRALGTLDCGRAPERGGDAARGVRDCSASETAHRGAAAEAERTTDDRPGCVRDDVVHRRALAVDGVHDDRRGRAGDGALHRLVGEPRHEGAVLELAEQVRGLEELLRVDLVEERQLPDHARDASRPGHDDSSAVRGAGQRTESEGHEGQRDADPDVEREFGEELLDHAADLLRSLVVVRLDLLERARGPGRRVGGRRDVAGHRALRGEDRRFLWDVGRVDLGQAPTELARCRAERSLVGLPRGGGGRQLVRVALRELDADGPERILQDVLDLAPPAWPARAERGRQVGRHGVVGGGHGDAGPALLPGARELGLLVGRAGAGQETLERGEHADDVLGTRRGALGLVVVDARELLGTLVIPRHAGGTVQRSVQGRPGGRDVVGDTRDVIAVGRDAERVEPDHGHPLISPWNFDHDVSSASIVAW